MIKNIIFDFDGVLVESVDIKTDAFEELFSNITDSRRLAKIVDFHIGNGGMSRFDKFKYIYANILKRPLSADEFDRLCDDFASIVLEKVVEANSVAGAPEFLTQNASRYDMFVVSATPDAEINDIVRRRKMARYFKGIYGSPATKASLLTMIVKENGYSPKETMFIGDSENDYDAAREAGVPFAARIIGGSNNFKGKKLVAQFEDMFDLARYLNSVK